MYLPRTSFASYLQLLTVCIEKCRMEQMTPALHLLHLWTVLLTPQLRQHQLCLQAAHQQMKNLLLLKGPLPMVCTCQMAQLL